MRKFIIMILVVILVVLCLPAAVGQYLKYDLQQKLAKASWPKGYIVKLISYKSGWFRSRANIQVLMTPTISELSKASITKLPILNMNLQVFHGPLTYSKDFNGNARWFLGQGVLKGMAQVEDIPLKVYSLIYFNSDIDLLLQNDGYHRAGEIPFNIGKFHTHLLITKKYSHISGTSIVQQLYLDGKLIQLSLPLASSSFSLSKGPKGIWIGPRSNSISALSLFQSNKNVLDMQGIIINSLTALNGKMISASVNAQIKKIIPADYYAFGPAKLNYKITHVNLDNLVALNKFIAQADLSKKSNSSELLLYIVALAQGTQQNLSDFSVKTPRGMASLTGQITLPTQAVNVNQPVNNSMLNAMYMELGSKSKFHLKAIMPIELVADIMNKLSPKDQSWMTQLNFSRNAGIILTSGKFISTEVFYDKGMTIVNGRPLQQVIMEYQKQVNQASQQKNLDTPQPLKSSTPQPSLQQAIQQELQH